VAARSSRVRSGSSPGPSCAPSADLRVPHRRQRLTVTAAASVVLATLLLEDEDLLVAELGDDLAPDRDALDQWRADPDRVAAGEQHLGELDRAAGLAVELLDADERPGLDPVLLASGADDGVGHDENGATHLPRKDRVCT